MKTLNKWSPKFCHKNKTIKEAETRSSLALSVNTKKLSFVLCSEEEAIFLSKV
jgi:hypothetical protein